MATCFTVQLVAKSMPLEEALLAGFCADWLSPEVSGFNMFILSGGLHGLLLVLIAAP